MEQNNTINPPLNSFVEQSKDTKNQGIKQPETNIPLDELESEFDNLERKLEATNTNYGLFKVQGANQWIDEAKLRPIPKMLFDTFWFQGEICILFADTNLGKSILAVQIGNAISKGKAINGFRLEAPSQKVLYFDFELSDKQFENRYSNDYKEHYTFHADFQRAEINTDIELPDNLNFEDYLNISLEQVIEETEAKVLIIDNLTYLKNETEKAKNALPLMKHLKKLKAKYNLSLLILAHTPKRDLSKPIIRNDLQGSKMLINFCDSCFAIGESTKGTGLRYLKQIKVRNTEHTYGEENVILCQIEKPFNFLAFDFIDYSTEREHLKQISEKDKEQLDKSIIELYEQNPSLSNRKIARQLGTSHPKVGRIIKAHKEASGT